MGWQWLEDVALTKTLVTWWGRRTTAPVMHEQQLVHASGLAVLISGAAGLQHACLQTVCLQLQSLLMF